MPQHQSPVITAHTERALRILVADDNEDSASTLTFLLQAMGHTVCKVNDGEAALTQVPGFDPQLVLLDIGMPKLNGYETCRRIRVMPGANERTIVAITGWSQPKDRRISHAAGFDKHLVKPFDLAELRNIIDAMHVAVSPKE